MRELKISKSINLTIILAVLMLFANSFPSSAAGTVAHLSAEEVHLNDSTVLVPVNISGNPGIMGFKITIEFPSEKIAITNATAGSVTSNGSFVHNAGKVNGKLDVIWYSSEQTFENGSLFILSIKPTDGFAEGESAEILLSFSQADTFNEKYEDVAFDCQPIKVYRGEQASQAATESVTKAEKTESSITDEQLIEAVDVALDNSDRKTIDNINSETLVVVNENLRTMGGSAATQYNTVDELQKAYRAAVRNQYFNQAQINIAPETIISIAKEVLEPREVSSFSELSAEDKKCAVDEMYDKMHSADDTLPEISNIIPDDQSADMFDDLLEDSKTDSHQDKNKSETTGNLFPVLAIIIAIVIVGGIICLIVVRRIKTRKD